MTAEAENPRAIALYALADVGVLESSSVNHCKIVPGLTLEKHRIIASHFIIRNSENAKKRAGKFAKIPDCILVVTAITPVVTVVESGAR
jgi:hypothetical protein